MGASFVCVRVWMLECCVELGGAAAAGGFCCVVALIRTGRWARLVVGIGRVGERREGVRREGMREGRGGGRERGGSE